MTYLYFRVASLLNVALSIMITFMLMLKFDDNRVADFLTAPEICDGFCLLGIRPGTTTLGEALSYLETHAWVESVELSAPGTGYGQIRWLWSGQQPDLIDDTNLGRITFYWVEDELNAPAFSDVKIQTIAIYTDLRMALLQNRYGPPDSGLATIRLDGNSIGYSAAYHVRGSTISLSTILPCPVNLMSYWNAVTKITVSMGQGTSQYVPPVEMVKMC